MKKIYHVPSKFVPTAQKLIGRKLIVEFTKYKYGIRQKPFIEKIKIKKYFIPKGMKVTKASTIERGWLPKRFWVKFEKD